MHGLDQIHSLNEQAARNEHHRSCQAALSQGHSYIAVLDGLGNPDFTVPITTFPTVASLKAHALAKIKIADYGDFKFAYGRNV